MFPRRPAARPPAGPRGSRDASPTPRRPRVGCRGKCATSARSATRATAPEVGRATRAGRPRRPARRRAWPPAASGGDAMGDGRVPGSISGATNVGRRPESTQPVDDRGVDVALDDDRAAVRWSLTQLAGGVGQRHADRVVAAGRPHSGGTSCASAPQASAANRWARLEGSRFRTDVDPLDFPREGREGSRPSPSAWMRSSSAPGPLVPRKCGSDPGRRAHIGDDGRRGTGLQSGLPRSDRIHGFRHKSAATRRPPHISR